MTDFNMLSAGDTIGAMVRREKGYGIDIRWNRSTGAADDRETMDCAPDEGERATIYLMTDLGEAIPLHDSAPGPDGAAEAARIVAETYRALAQRGAA